MKIAITLVTAMLALTTQAELLATFYVDSRSGHGVSGTPTEFGIGLVYSSARLGFHPFSEADIGVTREYEKSNPTWNSFNGVIDYLTNGEDDTMSSASYIGDNLFVSPIASDSSILGSSSYSTNGIDLAGSTIENITFTLQEGIISKGLGGVVVDYAGTFSIYGTAAVPESSMISFMSIFGGGLWFIRRRRLFR